MDWTIPDVCLLAFRGLCALFCLAMAILSARESRRMERKLRKMEDRLGVVWTGVRYERKRQEF